MEITSTSHGAIRKISIRYRGTCYQDRSSISVQNIEIQTTDTVSEETNQNSTLRRSGRLAALRNQ